jgi:septation ring formation regulator EzrA
MDYYNPADLNAEDLIKRVRIGRATEELIRTPTGLSLIERAIFEYREGIEALQKMVMQEWSGSSEEELQQYRKLSNNLATPLKVLHWMDAIITDGENAESIARYKDTGET